MLSYGVGPTGGTTHAEVRQAAEGSWTEHYPELGTGLVSYEDSISPDHYELERDAIFRKTWLNVGRLEHCHASGATSPRSSTPPAPRS